MVECPGCNGDGYVLDEDGEGTDVVRCDVCNGSGHLTQEDYDQWAHNVVDVYEAQRRYIRDQTAD